MILKEVGVAFELNKGILELIKLPKKPYLIPKALKVKRTRMSFVDKLFFQSTVLVAIAIACLAYFVFDLGMLTCSRSIQKLKALEHWFLESFKSVKLE